jgi:hypothetical protein
MSKRILDIQGWSIYIQPKIKMKNKTSHHTVGAVQRSNIKIVERGKTKTANIQIHNRPLSRIDRGTSTKSGGVKLVFYGQTSNVDELIRTCKGI